MPESEPVAPEGLVRIAADDVDAGWKFVAIGSPENVASMADDPPPHDPGGGGPSPVPLKRRR